MFWMFLINTIGILMMWVAFWFLLIITQKGGSTSKSSSFCWSFFCSESGTASSWAKKKTNNCSYSFRLQVKTSGRKVSWQRGWKGCPDPIPNNCSPKPEPGHWAAGPAGRKANNSSFQGGSRRLGTVVKRTIIPSFGGCRLGTGSGYSEQ